MRNGKFFVLISAIAMLGALATASAKDHHERGGHVMACSLHGVNPAHHPEIFGDPDVAHSYGFVKSDSGKWHVENNCHRSRRA
jgi:hypothetical protein